jgi:hypothetical protein
MIKYIMLTMLGLALVGCPVQCPDGYEDIGIGQCVKKEDNK